MDASSDHSIQAAPMVDWSSLPADIVKEVGNLILATGDVDYYMNLRAVCHDWRPATDDPKAHLTHHRFRLQQWILLVDENSWSSSQEEQTDSRLFLNTATGRFLRKHPPGILNFYFITNAGGLLVLASRIRPHATRIVNPLTASCLNFMAPMPTSLSSTTGLLQPCGSSLTLVPDLERAYLARPDDAELFTMMERAYLARPDDAELFTMMERAYLARPDAELFTMVEYDMAYKVRMVWGIGEENEEKIGDLVRSINTVFPNEMRRCYRDHHFIISGGDMLFIIIRPHRPGVDVFKVRCIGGRTLFLGDCRCISVDANKFPSINGDYIFYVGGGDIHMYDLIKDEEEVAEMNSAGLVLSAGVADRSSSDPSMIQLLIRYCINTPWSQLGACRY